MKDFFNGWGDWMILIFLMAILALPMVEESIQKEYAIYPNQIMIIPTNIEGLPAHGYEENKKAPELAITKPAIVGTASLPSTSFFPVFTMSHPKYGLILSNISLPSVITSGSISS